MSKGGQPKPKASYRRSLQINRATPKRIATWATPSGSKAGLSSRSQLSPIMEIKPDFAERLQPGNALRDQGRLAEGRSQLSSRTLEIKADFPDVHSNLLFRADCAAGAPLVCLNEARAYGRRLHEKVGARFSCLAMAPSPYACVSGWCQVTCAATRWLFLEGLLAHIDSARVELLAYPTERKQTTSQPHSRPYFCRLEAADRQGDEAAARMIHADGVPCVVGSLRPNRQEPPAGVRPETGTGPGELARLFRHHRCVEDGLFVGR